MDGTGIMVFEKRPAGGTGDILFRFTDPVAPRAVETFALPPIVNTPADEGHPAITPDGRYIGFVRQDEAHLRAFVWDTGTQTLVDEDGFDLGQIDRTARGNLSLRVDPLVKFTRVGQQGLISFNLLDPTGVGILVQRVVGKHELFGKTAPKPVGRVPLGKFKKGRGHVRWNGRVNGRRLKPGRYQVTVRAVSPKGAVLDFGTPRTFTVR